MRLTRGRASRRLRSERPCSIERYVRNMVSRLQVETEMKSVRPKHRRVTRREAAKMIGVSLSYVRKLTAQKKLAFVADRNGTFVAEHAQIESFARERRTRRTTSSVVAAKVSAMLKAKRTFDEIVIATEEILRLYERRDVGLSHGKQQAAVANGGHCQRKQGQPMREMDTVLERRRRDALRDESEALEVLPKSQRTG